MLLLSILSAIVTIYTILCVVDIFLSWFPGAKKSSVGKIISTICDPYLNLFSKIKFLRIGNIDFSPIISIGILSLLSSILAGLTATGRIYLGGILGTIIQMLWSVISMFLFILLLFSFIRWITLASNKNSAFWNQIDSFLQKVAYKISKPFSKGVISYKQALLITWIILIAGLVVGYILSTILTGLCYRLPI